MAITTTNGKLAIMELEQVYEPGLPISPGTLGQEDQQQLLWGFPEILWGAAAVPNNPGMFWQAASIGPMFWRSEDKD